MLRTFDFMSLMTRKRESAGCILCGRKLGSNHAWVRVCDGGGVAAHLDDYHLIDEMSDLGMQPIGAECKRKFPPEFIS